MEPVTILCMKWGRMYGPDYVNNLARGVRRHLSRPHRFVCFTDDASGLDAGVEALPLPAGADVRVVIDDARAALPDVVAPGTADLVVLDVFSGRDAPAHLTEPSFYAEAAGVLAPGGVLVVNVGDDPGLAFFAGQARAMREALADVWCLAEERLLTGRYPGNLVLVGGRRALPREWAEVEATASGDLELTQATIDQL